MFFNYLHDPLELVQQLVDISWSEKEDKNNSVIYNFWGVMITFNLLHKTTTFFCQVLCELFFTLSVSFVVKLKYVTERKMFVILDRRNTEVKKNKNKKKKNM